MCVYSNLRIPRNSCWMCCFTFCTYDIKYQKSEGLLDDKSVYESTVFQNAMEKNESFCTSASLLLDLFFFRLNCHLHSQLFPFSEIKLVWQRLKFTLKIKKKYLQGNWSQLPKSCFSVLPASALLDKCISGSHLSLGMVSRVRFFLVHFWVHYRP